ncbi:MAG TPA: hypothetical protein DDX39_10785 [Bacteroidales bacterium]|nr:MAG: hypothetical protein A2W98_13175 [Bacteroidetes bacterium GWF2_33_38]OFY72974.1 MAG: hypothetical protein A2265_06685 [Bacteroidetes bacterium RIFOXYA12_FULL_33_9]OFY89813.1 MAG: hypothetical protein A2236_13310 [Bacteroidetes bacterium RIFOXYA2_FULL_33_7]HBF89117.1 hypothetical protein [Bacteroidales bacterium]
MAINREKIIEDMSKIQVVGDKNGIIDGFGVFVNQLPSDFWIGFSEKLVGSVDNEIIDATEALLVNAAQECGYHTGYGIITCEEWKAVVQPMVENVEDVLHGAFAILTAWGWANSEIVELIPGEKLVVRAHDYYEADVVMKGKSSMFKAYMVKGICAAFMALAYSGEYSVKGEKVNDFTCKQTKGIECGDAYGEFIVLKA